jgi:manganese transport protein
MQQTANGEPRYVQRGFLSFLGPGVLVAVGYMDPGNWATDIEAGSRFGFGLLFVVLLASLMAMVLQVLCVRVGIATGKDLAQLCRQQYSGPTRIILWLLAELAIIACDIAEVLGAALAFHLLFGVSIEVGIWMTALNLLIIFAFQGRGIRPLEVIVLSMVMIITVSFLVQVFLSEPPWAQVARGLIPEKSFLTKESWYVAIGILGATVMPHNLYLHTSLVQAKVFSSLTKAKSFVIRMMSLETIITLGIAFFINAAILIVAGSVFHLKGYREVTEIQDAYKLLEPLLGTSIASILFALALLAAGQSSSITGTIAGQVILEGFLNLKMPVWQRRLLARFLAIVPAWLGVRYFGEHSLGKLLVGTQVVLSLQLPFAVIPLVMFSGNKNLMGPWVSGKLLRSLSWFLCGTILAANVWLFVQLL